VNNVLSNNGPDEDVPTVKSAAITIYSGLIPIGHTVISANRISNEFYGVFLANSTKVSGLRSNQFEAVSVEVSGD